MPVYSVRIWQSERIRPESHTDVALSCSSSTSLQPKAPKSRFSLSTAKSDCSSSTGTFHSSRKMAITIVAITRFDAASDEGVCLQAKRGSGVARRAEARAAAWRAGGAHRFCHSVSSGCGAGFASATHFSCPVLVLVCRGREGGGRGPRARGRRLARGWGRTSP
jgi:hypothetical protein